MYEPKGTHLIAVSASDIAAAWRVVNRLAHRLGREDVDVTFVEAYASEVTGTYLHHQGGARRMLFHLEMCSCNPYDGKGYHRPGCPAPYPSLHQIRVWESSDGRWRLADNTNKKLNRA